MDALTQWLTLHYGQEHFTPELDRIRLALIDLKDSFKNTKIITIAGTNGKGETSLRLSSLLKSHRHCTWTSPHIESITERFRTEAGEISIIELESLIYSCHEALQKQQIKLTYYEFLFYVFIHWAHKRNCEFLILEVGLGGRLDAVNIFDADLVLLTSISRDHQEFLGNRYELILREKLGVLRSGAMLISFLDLKYLREKTQLYVDHLKARMVELEELGVLGRENFSYRNQLLAYAAYLYLQNLPLNFSDWRADDHPIENRGEVIRRGQAEWTLYGSHNVDGLRKLIQFLGHGPYNLPRTSFDAVILAFSKRDPRDLRTMLKMIKASGLKNVKVTCFNHPKAATRELLEGPVGQEGLEFVEEIDSIVQGANTGKILVGGSYYFLGHIKSLLRR